MAEAEMLRMVAAVFDGSNGDTTKRLYDRLEKLGPAGVVALNLFRACKASGRAKKYRGRGYRGMAYDKKHWSMTNACRALKEHAAACGIEAWGWQVDPDTRGFEHVLYVELPTGQVSFHSDVRGDGPVFCGVWDFKHESPARIVRWCAELLDAAKVPA